MSQVEKLPKLLYAPYENQRYKPGHISIIGIREVSRNPTITCCFSFLPPARNKFLKIMIPFSVE